MTTAIRNASSPNSIQCCRQFSSATQGCFKASDLVIQRIEQPKAHQDTKDLVFGQSFTDHMFLVEHVEGQGWGQPVIKPFGNISMHPAAQALHYGVCCFEGMKGYLGKDGKARLFRPDMNMARMKRSTTRLRLADYDADELLECLKQLLRIDKDWLPHQEGYSMYIRPFAFSSAHTLGISKPSRSTIAIVMSPVGPYFPTGLKPISLFIDEHNVRAWPGGVGNNKVGTNYAPTIGPQSDAADTYGTSQVLYSFPQGSQPDDALVSECGAMNLMFFLQKADGITRELVTPPLDGTILPGVTRDSVLQLTRGWGEFEVSERQLSIKEIKQAAKDGRLLEMFGCGTACIIQPVTTLIRANGEEYTVPFDLTRTDTLTQRLTRALTDIHFANVPHEWSVAID